MTFPGIVTYPGTATFPGAPPGFVAGPTALTVNSLYENQLLSPPSELAADLANGNTFTNGPAVWLEATNTGGSIAQFAVAFAGKVDGQTVPARIYVLPAGGEVRAGTFPIGLYGSTVNLIASSSSVTLAVYQLGA